MVEPQQPIAVWLFVLIRQFRAPHLPVVQSLTLPFHSRDPGAWERRKMIASFLPGTRAGKMYREDYQRLPGRISYLRVSSSSRSLHTDLGEELMCLSLLI